MRQSANQDQLFHSNNEYKELQLRQCKMPAIQDRDIRLFRKAELVTLLEIRHSGLSYGNLFRVVFAANTAVSVAAWLFFLFIPPPSKMLWLWKI